MLPALLMTLALMVTGYVVARRRGYGVEVFPGWRAVLLRLLNNIRGRALQGGNQARGLQIMQRMLLIAPADARLWLESAAIQAKSGQLKGAREAVETCLGLEPEVAIQQQACMGRAEVLPVQTGARTFQ